MLFVRALTCNLDVMLTVYMTGEGSWVVQLHQFCSGVCGMWLISVLGLG